MKTRIKTVSLLLVLACTGVANAQTQVDLSVLDRDMTGSRAQVLVLGSVHLSQLPDSFKTESLQPVIDRLLAFKPDVITIEGISGEQCDIAQRYPAVYGPKGLDSYCFDPAGAKATTGLDVPAAVGEMRKLLADWPTSPTPAQRRHLAAVFLAANESASALVQWLQLTPTERHVGDALDGGLVAHLEMLRTRKNENYLIAARVAADLGLQRVFAVDDHSGDNVDIPDAESDEFGKSVQGVWDSGRVQGQAMMDRQDALSKDGDMLALYRYINQPDTLRVVVDTDFGASMRYASPLRYPQMYVAGWETRNLRMVANIRAAFREHPGARVLSIVGSSHKPWFDSLLGQMQGVDIINAEQVLK